MLIDILIIKLREILFEEPSISSEHFIFQLPSVTKLLRCRIWRSTIFLSGVKILCSFQFVRKISRVSDGNKMANTKNSPLRGQVLTGGYQFFLFFWKGPCFLDTFVFYSLYLYLSKNSTSIFKKGGTTMS